MLLSDWLQRERVSRSDFADRIGVSPSHVTGLCDGTSWPSRKVARAIGRETGGAVTADDFLSLDAGPAKEATPSLIEPSSEAA